MSARYQLFHAAVLLASAVLLDGCAATTEIAVVSHPLPPQHLVLELRIAHVTIHHQPMLKALTMLDEQIRRQSSGKLALRYVWHSTNPDSIITIDARDISLRGLLDEMCRQSGLAYDPDAPPGIYFDELHNFRHAGQ